MKIRKNRGVRTKRKSVEEDLKEKGLQQISINELLYPESNKKSYQSNPRKIIQNDE